MPDFFDIPTTDLPEGVVSDTTLTFSGYKIRKIVRVIKMKRKVKTEERFFCLKEGLGKRLPENVREHASRKGYKTLSSLFSVIKYYQVSLGLE